MKNTDSVIKANFKKFLEQEFISMKIFADNILIPIFGKSFSLEHKHLAESINGDNCIKDIIFCGEANGDAIDAIRIYEVILADRTIIARSRANIQRALRSLLANYTHALIVFHYDDPKNKEWRFSYAFKECSISKTTTPKRYTYLLGPGHACSTAAERFNMLAQSSKKDEDFKTAFSVEALSKEFFNSYKQQYSKFCDFIYKNKKDRTLFGKEFSEWEDKIIRDYVKKMFGRIVFLYFLQKKGWLGVPATSKKWDGGDRNFMLHLFEGASPRQQESYLDQVLEPLFFNCLNEKRADDIFDTGVKNIGQIKIPYLNGGLFEKEEIDEPKSKFPREYFKEFLEFLSTYNFTIDENDPNDAEVGVDPEMLGKIFENLLEDNNDKGAFYTPKEIVQYMCRESLIAYLQTNAPEEKKDAIRELITTHDSDMRKQFTQDEIGSISEKLDTVKICDPAIGSGAFPMGLLNELVACHEALGCNRNISELKRGIIQNNIYGVDIEKGAVDIARLRFWLSIVVDSEKPEPLPNLDYKIMQGNSLIESYEGVDLSGLVTGKGSKKDGNQITLEFDEKGARENIHNCIQKYFQPGCDKDALRKEINESTRNYLKLLTVGRPEVQKELNTLPIPNDKFFLWHTWFSDVFNSKKAKEGIGFDIVIGNPPYIQLQSNGGSLGNFYKNCEFETFASMGDIYCLFYEKGLEILRPDAHLCFITSNKWMRAGYGEATRKFFAEKANPVQLVDFAGVKIFESATVDTNILMLQKAKNQKSTQACITKSPDCLKNLSDYISINAVKTRFTNSDSWVILSPIEQSIKEKIEKNGIPLKNWDINIYRGVLTGYNEAFIISGEKREEILSQCQTGKERQETDKIIRPILRGRDIKRYSYEFADLYLIATFPRKM